MNPRRLVLVAVILVASGVPALLLTRSGRSAGPAPVDERPPCLEVPDAVALPSWFPADLPMPKGSAVTEVLPQSSSVRRVVFAAPASLDDFVRHVFKEWPPLGWTLGRGEREAIEAEDTFQHKDGRYGQFRARSVFCEKDSTEVVIAIVTPT